MVTNITNTERLALERIAGLSMSQFATVGDMASECVKVARAALAEAEGQAVPTVAEPVAWMWRNTKTDARGVYFEDPAKFFDLSVSGDYEWEQLYLHPPAPAVAEPLKGWKLNHVQFVPGSGKAEIGYLDPEDDRFSPIVTVDTGLYYEPNQAHPLAVAILAAMQG